MPTIEQLRVRIGLAEDDASRDLELAAALAFAIALIESYLDRKIEFLDDEQAFEGRGTILLRRWPVVVGSVIIETENGSYLTLTRTRVDYARGMIFHHSSFPVVVKWKGGFETYPPDLLWAIIAAFDAAWAATPGWGAETGGNLIVGAGAVKKVSLVGIGSVDLDVGAKALAAGEGGGSDPWGILPGSVTTILDRYSRESVLGVG
jgi:hypothetical protein